MAFTEEWNSAYEARPSVDEFLDQTLQPTLTGTKRNIRERMVKEHVWAVGETDGLHAFPSGPTSGRPTGVQGQIYFNGDRWTEEFFTQGAWTNLGIIAGVRLLCFSATVPLGYTIVTGVVDRVIRLIDTNAGVFAVGGSWTISGLSSGSAGAEALSGSFTTGQAANPNTVQDGTGASTVFSTHTHSVTVSLNTSNHSHAISQDGSWRPAYVDAYIIQKN